MGDLISMLYDTDAIFGMHLQFQKIHGKKVEGNQS